jgi:thiol-disulfide isomerase/thioredoxin
MIQDVSRSRAFVLSAALASAMSLAASPAPAEVPHAAAQQGRAWLGIQMADAEGGVLVRHVMRGSPAEKAGLKDGDIITSVERQSVSKPEHVSSAVALHGPGDSMVVTVRRGTRTLDVTAQLELKPTPDQALARDMVGAPAPAWVDVAPLAGAPASLDALRGRVVVVDFWASFCGPCRYMTPELSALDARYHAQGLTVVGITTDNAETAAATRERWGMRYGVVVDRNGRTNASYGVSALPTMFVVDRKGVIRHVSVGAGRSETERIDAVVRQLLAEP